MKEYMKFWILECQNLEVNIYKIIEYQLLIISMTFKAEVGTTCETKINSSTKIP